MVRIKVATLKAELSRCLELVENGEQVLDHAVLDLRPGAAAQLASARRSTDDRRKLRSLSLDARLNDAARRERFQIA